MTPLDPNLLRAVIERPGCDHTRLVCADYLDEICGDVDRAEFIRCQITGNRQLERSLFDNLRKQLAFPGCSIGIEPIQTGRLPRPLIVFRRGFGDSVHCTREEWQRLGPKIVGRQPIGSVRLWGMSPNITRDFVGYRLRYAWHFLPRPLTAWELPIEWRLESDIVVWATDNGSVAYEWLSNLAVNWARREAGLGVLENSLE